MFPPPAWWATFRQKEPSVDLSVFFRRRNSVSSPGSVQVSRDRPYMLLATEGIFFPFSSSPATHISKADYAEHGMLPIKKYFECARQHLIWW